jgi:heme-degrading monooxygenase HmoA
MPALPWTTISTPDPARSYVGFATLLPLTRHRHIPGFLRDTLRVRRQLAAAPGLVGYSLLAGLGAKTFWTVSVWEDESALRAFAAAEPHRDVTRRTPDRMGASRFQTFAVTGAEVPLRWADVRQRFAAS